MTALNNLLKSNTMRGLLLMVVSAIVRNYSIDISDTDLKDVCDLIINVMTGAGAIWAFVGRVRAKGPILLDKVKK